MNTPLKTSLVWAGALLIMFAAGSASALEHVSTLRTGKLIIGSPVIYVLPASARNAAILPVLFENTTLENLEDWTDAFDTLQSSPESRILEPYETSIQSFSVKNALARLAQHVAAGVDWINHDQEIVLTPDAPGPLNTQAMRKLTEKSHLDAVVFLKPVIVFSEDYSKAYVIAPLTVYAGGPVRAFYLDSQALHADMSINQTRPELSNRGVEAVAASRRQDKGARRARLELWFAHDASRLKQAVEQNLRSLRRPLADFLTNK